MKGSGPWSISRMSRLQTPDSEVTKDQMSSCGRALPVNSAPPHSLMFSVLELGAVKIPLYHPSQRGVLWGESPG